MLGPFPNGHFTSKDGFRHLTSGNQYRIARSFTDFDGGVHEAGETWTFIGSSFLPHDDGLSLFVSPSGTDEWQVRLQWRPDAQEQVIESLRDFVVPAEVGQFPLSTHNGHDRFRPIAVMSALRRIKSAMTTR